MDVSALALCLLLTLTLTLLHIVKTIKHSRSGLPPGPRPWPIIGNLLQLGPKPHKSLSKLAETHGPIMSLKLGQITTIVISNATAAKQVLQKQDQAFANRTIPDSILACDHGNVSVGWMPFSPKWRELRRICFSQIFNNRKMQGFEHIRRQKMQDLIAELNRASSHGEVVMIGEAIFMTVLNFMSSIFLSCDLGRGREFRASFSSIMKLAGKPNMVDYLPWLKIVDPQRIRAQMTQHYSNILSLVDSIISQRLEQRAGKYSVSEGRDVLDSLLDIMLDSGSAELTRNDINHLFLDLLVAGTDTTSSTLEWALSEVMKSPDTISKAKAELDKAIGRGQQVEEKDIENLPYLQAIVKETFRLHPPIPLLPHKNIKEEEVWGYTIPKDSHVMVNVWAIGRNPRMWDCPDTFKPERFLDSEVDVKGAHFELIPFGAGRRMCAGMPLANKLIPLMLGSLLNCFDWKLEDGAELTMEGVFGLSLQRAQPLGAIPVTVRGFPLWTKTRLIKG